MRRLWYLAHAAASAIAVWLAFRFEPANACVDPHRDFDALMQWIGWFLIFQIVSSLAVIGFRYKDWPWNVVLGFGTAFWAILMLFVVQWAGLCL